MPQRILFFFNTFKALGGAERQAIILIDHLKKNNNYAIHVIGFEDGEKIKSTLQQLNVPYTVVPFRYYCSRLKKLITYIKLIRIIRSLKPNILMPYVAESNKIASELFPFSGAQKIIWNQREEGRNLSNSKKDKKLVKRATYIVSNSTEGQYFLSTTYNIPLNKILVINNGVLLPEIKNTNLKWHKRIGLDDDDLIISMIANITNRKDHKNLLQAWSKVMYNYRGNKKMKLVLAGRTQHKILNELKLLAFDLNICDSIKFVEFVEDVNSLIQESYFCVFSSNLEGCPNGILEAMAMKKAIIATNIRGSRQALGCNYENIVLVEPNKPEKFANKILDLVNNPELVIEIGKYNYKRIKAEFSVKQMMEGYLSLIEK